MTDDSSADAAELADQARQAVRALNAGLRRADGWPGLAGPGDAQAVLGSLRDLTAALQQTAAGLVGYLEFQLQDGRLEADEPYPDDPIAAVATIGAALDHAELHAGTTAAMLGDAGAAAGALYEVRDAEPAGELSCS